MTPIESTIHVAPAPHVTIKLAAAQTGLTEKAIRRKIEDGIWVEGREYRRGPDGHIYISMKDYAAWVEAGSMSGRGQSGSHSRSTGNRSAAPST